jgi:hypothetical protein
LDDTFIHLRYAQILHDKHFISFDGIHRTYGASSLLYVGVLALLRSATQSPMLPKVVSLAAYAGLLVVAYLIARLNRLGFALILVLVSPFAVRWLTDGMETSLACLVAVGFSILLYRPASPLALGSMALILSLLRVDLTLLVAFGVILSIDRKEWSRAVSLCIGSGLSLAFIQFTMGHLLPDTAVAKEGVPFLSVMITAAHEVAATFSFGLGIILIWVVSAVSAWRVDRRSALICNLPFPVLLLLAAVKGQQIHGIRYLIWGLLFSIVWNLMLARAVPAPRPIFLAAAACALIACWIVEVPIVLRVDRGRSESLAMLERSHLDQLHGEGLAGDVGYIGYFSEAPICDMNGLINGRAAAQMTYDQRSEACVAAQPSFLFVSKLQADYLDSMFHMNSETDWLNCGWVDFTNVGSVDRHFLLVRRPEYPNGCPAHLQL